MILLFPTADAVRLAVTAGVVPPDVLHAPAAFSIDSAGRVAVETDAKLAKKTREELDKLGVTAVKRHPAAADPVHTWLQIIPAVADPTPPQLASSAPVLFDLPDAAGLPVLVAEMLRLGNDRQGFRAVSSGADSRVLLRVIGPPYYTLLRAVDKVGEAVRAFVEKAPRVWVEVGTTHPFAAQLKAADGQILLVRGPRNWEFLPDAPFRDVYDLLQFQLPTGRADWQPAAVPAKIEVPVRLVGGNAADQAELWVVRGAGIPRLDALVRDADDRLTEQLTFAVAAAPDGEQTVVLRTRPSKKTPPVLNLDGAIGFKPFWKLPNLYLPAGARLHPTIRRDAVRKLLADDADVLVWLYPDGAGSFRPESVPEDAFRPLSDWVEYVIATNREPLAAWVESATFDFESFVCSDTPPKPKPPAEKPVKDKRPGDDPLSKAAPAKAGTRRTPGTEGGATAFGTPQLEIKPPSEWKIRRDELETLFLAADGPLDSPERAALWPQLAAANAGIGEAARDEAAVCWVNAMWATDEPPAGHVAGWVRTELPAAGPPTPADFDARMTPQSPTPGELRAFAAVVLAVASQEPPPAWLASRLPAVQAYLAAHDRALPVRAVWLIAVRLAQLAGADVLGLARVRDRILTRLLEEGLSPERDLPAFLRYAGLNNSERVRVVREQAVLVHRAARAWAEKSLKPAGTGAARSDAHCTLGYLDVLFAYGLAKLGEATAAQTLLRAAADVLVMPRPQEPKEKENVAPFANYLAAGFLYRAFGFRVDRALAGRPNSGLLSPELLDEVEKMQAKKGTGANTASNPYGMADYVIARMREQSRILEPQEKLDPYADWMKHGDELRKALAELPKYKDAASLTRAVRELYRDGVKGKPALETRFFVLHEALPLAARVGEAFTVELLQLVPDVLVAAPPSAAPAPADLPRKQGQLLERSLFLAAHFDRTDLVQKLVDQFIAYVRAKPDEQRYELVNVVAGQCLRSLRKLGLRDEIDKLLRRLQDEVLKGKTLAKLKADYAAKPDVWADALQTLLNLAAGWLTFGLTDQAAPILDAAREEVLSGGAKMAVPKFTKLVQAYVAALGQGPAETGLPRIVELFQTVPPGRVTNTFTTAPYYSRLHLNVVEEVVLALVSDDFALGQAGRRWLDDDEQAVRKRVHRDMKRHLASSGL